MWSLVGILLVCSCAALDKPAPTSTTVTVRGEIRRPGDYPLLKGMTVRQVIDAAGGYTQFASGVIVDRGNRRILFVTGLQWRDRTVSWDIPLQDQDVVFAQHME